MTGVITCEAIERCTLGDATNAQRCSGLQRLRRRGAKALRDKCGPAERSQLQERDGTIEWLICQREDWCLRTIVVVRRCRRCVGGVEQLAVVFAAKHMRLWLVSVQLKRTGRQ